MWSHCCSCLNTIFIIHKFLWISIALIFVLFPFLFFGKTSKSFLRYYSLQYIYITNIITFLSFFQIYRRTWMPLTGAFAVVVVNWWLCRWSNLIIVYTQHIRSVALNKRFHETRIVHRSVEILWLSERAAATNTKRERKK